MDEAAVSGEAGRNGEKGMRPVEKGEAPEVTFQTYSDAESYLEERLGCYCSFCEFHISHWHGKICCCPANIVIPEKERLLKPEIKVNTFGRMRMIHFMCLTMMVISLS